jgi:hypothetical protein
MLGSKKPVPLTFNHVRHAGDDPRRWTCNGCGKHYHRWPEPGTNEPVGSPLVSLEVSPWRASGAASQAEHEANLVRLNQIAHVAPWLGRRVSVSVWLDYCQSCGPKAVEMRKALAEEASAGKPAVTINAGLHTTAIKQYLTREARMWAIPEDFADIEWSCIKCHKRVNWGASKVVEEPLLKWHLDAVKDPYGRVTAAAGVASLCNRCARAIDPVARQAFQNQNRTGVTS